MIRRMRMGWVCGRRRNFGRKAWRKEVACNT